MSLYDCSLLLFVPGIKTGSERVKEDNVVDMPSCFEKGEEKKKK
jgi:hypothetical protein